MPTDVKENNGFGLDLEENTERVKKFSKEQNLIEMPPSVIKRMAALGIKNNLGESFLGHSEIVCLMVSDLLDHIEKCGNHREVWKIIASTRKNVMETAGFLHDIGKTGSDEADPMPFIKFYNINFNSHPSEISLLSAFESAVMRRYISEDEKSTIIKILKNRGYNPKKLTLRDFYNLSSLFTYEILHKNHMGEEISSIASAHHLKRKIIPPGYKIESFINTGAILETTDSMAAMIRKNHPKREFTPEQRIKSIYNSFGQCDRSIRERYQDLININSECRFLINIAGKYSSGSDLHC